MRDLVLALLAQEAVVGQELGQRLRSTLGPLAPELEGGGVYATLARLERAGLVSGSGPPAVPEPVAQVHGDGCRDADRAGGVSGCGHAGDAPGIVGEGHADRPDKRTFRLTEAGRSEVARWLDDTSWPWEAPTAFHLKLLVAGRTGLAEPAALVATQRARVVAELRDVRELAEDVSGDEAAELLIEGAVLRLEADLDWLGRCEERWLDGRVG